MILNNKTVDPSQLKAVILSCPKTGNTWLRWLLHHAYGLPIVDLSLDWTDQDFRTSRRTFVTHQHLWPSQELVKYLLDNNFTVFTTIRHPADTLLSWFHFGKWQDLSGDPAAGAMAQDGDTPGRNTLKFARFGFARAYWLSLGWAQLGAHVVRYEDLLADPVGRMRSLAEKISPLDEYKLKSAVLMCRPKNMIGNVDARHLRTATSGRGLAELPSEFAEAMAGIEPFRSACATYGYSWDRDAGPRPFDYDSIDPFRGRGEFDNGEPVGPWLAKIYLYDAVDALKRWPDATVTAGDSFWAWLTSPSPEALMTPEFPPQTLTNLMMAVYRMRADIQEQFPDPVNADRAGFAVWFIGQAGNEFELPWGLIAPVSEAYSQHLEMLATESAPSEGRITRIAIRNAQGEEAERFACGEEIHVEFELTLERPVERGVVGFLLRGADGRHVFGTNTAVLESPLPTLEPGAHVFHVSAKLSIPPQICYVSVGVARFTTGRIMPVHRLYDYKRITVLGGASSGAAWCETRIALAPAHSST